MIKKNMSHYHYPSRIRSSKVIKKTLANILTACGLSLFLASYSTHSLADVNLSGLKIISPNSEKLRAEVTIGELTPSQLAGLKVFVEPLNTSAKITTSLEKRGNIYVVRMASNDRIDVEELQVAIQANIYGEAVSEKSYTFKLNKQASNNNNNSTENINAQQEQKQQEQKRKELEKAINILSADSASTRLNKTFKATRTKGASSNDEANQAVRQSTSDEYRVKSGDTLSTIAGQHRRNLEGVNLDQVLVAIYQNNKNSFVNGNMNYLKSNSRLKLPDNESVASISARGAKLEILANAEQYNRYRQSISQNVSKRQPKTQENNSGKVNSNPAQLNVAAEVQDNLKLTKAQKSPEEAKLADTLSAEEEKQKQAELEKINQTKAQLDALKTASATDINTSAAPVNASAASISAENIPIDAKFEADAMKNLASQPASNVQGEGKNLLAENTTAAPEKGQFELSKEVIKQNKNAKSTLWLPIGLIIASILGLLAFFLKRRHHKTQLNNKLLKAKQVQDELDEETVNSGINQNTTPNIRSKVLPSAYQQGAAAVETSNTYPNNLNDPKNINNKNDYPSSQANNNYNFFEDENYNEDNDHDHEKFAEQLRNRAAMQNDLDDKQNNQAKLVKSLALNAEKNLDNFGSSQNIPSSLLKNKSVNAASNIEESDIPMLDDSDFLEELEGIDELEEIQELDESSQTKIMQDHIPSLSSLDEFELNDSEDDLNHSNDVNHRRQTQSANQYTENKRSATATKNSSTGFNNSNTSNSFHSTKFELAKAYLDIDDIEGAKSLLIELAAQKDDFLIQKSAQKLLTQLN